MIFLFLYDIITCRHADREISGLCFLYDGRRVTVAAFRIMAGKNRFIRFLINAQKTPWYPALFAALCIIAGTNNHTVYIPILWVLASFVLFSVFFTDDNKVFLTPLLMIFFALGCDTSSDAFVNSNGEMLSFMDDNAFVQVVILCVVCVGSLLIRLIDDGSVVAAFKKRRLFTWSIVAMDVAFLTSGLFSPVSEIKNLGYGALLAMGFTVVYFLVSGMLEKSEDPVTYACYAMLGTAYVAFTQIMTVVIEKYINNDLIIIYGATNPGHEIIKINKDELTLGWGISTVIAAVFVLGIPAAMYLAKKSKWSFLMYFSAPLFLLGTVIINCRAAMIIGFVALVLCAVVGCITGKNKVAIRIYTVILALAVIAFAIYVHLNVMPLSVLIEKLADILRLVESNPLTETGRMDLWKNGLEDFRSAPVFGVGFNDGGYPAELRSNNFYSNMYHCILVQIPAAMGIVGCLAFIFHIIHLIKLCFKKFSVDRLFIVMIPCMILGMSLVDNFFFYLHFQIFYGVFIAIAEKMMNGETN